MQLGDKVVVGFHGRVIGVTASMYDLPKTTHVAVLTDDGDVVEDVPAGLIDPLGEDDAIALNDADVDRLRRLLQAVSMGHQTVFFGDGAAASARSVAREMLAEIERVVGVVAVSELERVS